MIARSSRSKSKIGHGHALGHGHEKLRPLLRKFFGTLIYAKNLQRELLHDRHDH
jgi:hypothetical protein